MRQNSQSPFYVAFLMAGMVSGCGSQEEGSGTTAVSPATSVPVQTPVASSDEADDDSIVAEPSFETKVTVLAEESSPETEPLGSEIVWQAVPASFLHSAELPASVDGVPLKMDRKPAAGGSMMTVSLEDCTFNVLMGAVPVELRGRPPREILTEFQEIAFSKSAFGGDAEVREETELTVPQTLAGKHLTYAGNEGAMLVRIFVTGNGDMLTQLIATTPAEDVGAAHVQRFLNSLKPNQPVAE